MPHTPTSVPARHRHFATICTGVALALILLASWSTATAATPGDVTLPRAHSAAFAPVAIAPELPTFALSSEHTWTIQIDTAGYQDELDQCLWVRMDFEAVVPIVGKHNSCGGDIVLDMTPGQTVQLVGLGLDGTYLVTGDRLVFAGDPATEATAGLTAAVILQTCYDDATQGMRLVTLIPVPLVARVVALAS